MSSNRSVIERLAFALPVLAIGFGAILLMLGTLRWRRHVQGAQDEIRGRPPPAVEPNGELAKSPHPVAADRDRI